MDTNNNSNETATMASQQQQQQQQQEEPEHSQGSPSHVKQELDDDTELNSQAERIELFAKYDASDMLGQDSGTQTPIEDEPHGSEATNDSHGDGAGDQDDQVSSYDAARKDGSVSAHKAGVIRVLESEEDGSESIEIELEEDNTLLLTSLTSLFPDATGLKYRHPETNTLRGVKLVDDRFTEPMDGWSAVRSYVCVFSRGTKRKNDDEDDSSKKMAKSDGKVAGENGSDLVVLGLPWTTTEETMKNYFEQYGEVSMVQVKTDPKSGKSRGFGFVRFTKSSIQNKLLTMRHFIDGRWCDVRVPLSKAEAEATKAAQLSRKIFVGRLPDNITTDDLRNHFSEYGTLTDVFIPKPFRNFAFVTFGTSDMAQSIFKHKHVIKGAPVQISEAIPRDNGPNNYSGNFSGGPQNNNNNYGSGYGGSTNNNIHPFNSNYNTHQASHHFHNKNNFSGNFSGANMYQNTRKMHPQSTYYQMPSYGSSGPSSSVDSSGYVNHSTHSDYGSFSGATSSYNQQAGNVNGGQYYKMQQQQTIMTPNQNHSTYPNQSSYPSHGANFSRSSYGSVWK